MFGLGKKRKFLEKNADFLAELIGVRRNDAEHFYRSLTYFELQYEFSKVSPHITADDLMSVAQGAADIVYDSCLSEPRFLSSLLNRGHLEEVWIMGYAAKIGAALLGRNSFKGTVAEREVFAVKFREFCDCPVRNASGELVPLLVFLSDPIGNRPGLQSVKGID